VKKKKKKKKKKKEDYGQRKSKLWFFLR